eukprot:412126-Hanusia_phi.AAC.1
MTDYTELAIGLIILSIWAVVYFYYAVVQKFNTGSKNESSNVLNKLDTVDYAVDYVVDYAVDFAKEMDRAQERRFYLLLTHGFVYAFVCSIISESLMLGYWSEIFALFTAVLFALFLYIGEEIGIAQMNRSLHNPLPMESDKEKEEKIYYRNNYMIRDHLMGNFRDNFN